MHHHHYHFGHPVYSFIAGGIFGIGGYFIQHPDLTNFFIDLSKVCLFGFAGGIFGAIGRLFLIKFAKRFK